MSNPKVAFCIPAHPTPPLEVTLASLKHSCVVAAEMGWPNFYLIQRGCPYISRARAELLHKALLGGADVIVFIDSDMSWRPRDMLKLLETEGDVVAGTYRLKKDEEEYMGTFTAPRVTRADGALAATGVPAGFLKVTRAAAERFAEKLPHLKFGDPAIPHVDLFNHGAKDGEWLGEDIAFCRNWTQVCGGEIWVVPDLNIDHWRGDKRYPGNLKRFLEQEQE